MAKRVRRSPEEARTLILDAAEQVFADLGPDAAKLRDVADAAGVTHGLVTHYFGTFDNLVEATLERSTLRIRDQIMRGLLEADEVNPERVLELFFRLLHGSNHGRLFAWAMLSGRAQSETFFARRTQGPRVIVDAIEGVLKERFPELEMPREEIEHLVLLVLSSGFGIALGEGLLWEGLGYEPSESRDGAYRAWLSDVVRGRFAAYGVALGGAR